jgi:hypothetical protein
VSAVNNNIIKSDDDQPEGTQTIYLNEDNISNNDNSNVNQSYVPPNDLDNDTIISINTTVTA